MMELSEEALASCLKSAVMAQRHQQAPLPEPCSKLNQQEGEVATCQVSTRLV